MKEMNSIVYVAEQSTAEHPCEKQSIGSERRVDVGEWGVGLVKDLWVLLSHFLSLSLTPPVSRPPDLCGSHVPDSSLSERPIDRWI